MSEWRLAEDRGLPDTPLQPPLTGARENLFAGVGRLAVGCAGVRAEAHRGYVHAVGRAESRLILVAAAAAERAALVEADAHLPEAVARPAARHGDHVGLQLRVGGYELGYELARRDRHALLDRAGEAARYLDLVVQLAREVEVAVHTQPRAGAVRAIL